MVVDITKSANRGSNNLRTVFYAKKKDLAIDLPLEITSGGVVLEEIRIVV
jgi:hypothetical protein